MKNNIVAIILAGGKSQRMGKPKGLLIYKNKYWILEQLNRLTAIQPETIYIGLGFDYTFYFEAIPWLTDATNKPVTYNNINVNVVINSNPEKGSFSTLTTVLNSIPKKHTVLLNPIDVPIPNKETLLKIIKTHNTVVIPMFEEKNGHPVKITSTFWYNLLNVNKNLPEARLDVQIKKLSKTEISYVAVNDNSVVKNLNTPLQWEVFLNEN